MQAMSLAAPGGIDQLALVDVEPRAPSSHEIQVAIKATSLNFHDYAVVVGLIPAADGRIPMSDGAGVVTAVGDAVSDFSVGDNVISHFFPNGSVVALQPPACKAFPGIMLTVSRRSQ